MLLPIKAKVWLARTAKPPLSPKAMPVSACKPEGKSSASTGVPLARARLMAFIQLAYSPVIGRVSPRPNRASTMRSARASCWTICDAVGSWLWHCPPADAQAAWAARASGGVFSSAGRATTLTPCPCARNRRAATRPSPPLLPLPQKIQICAGVLPASSASTCCAAAAPARSIRGRPCAKKCASMWRSWAVEYSFMPGLAKPVNHQAPGR